MRLIAVINQKGGVGKTTITANLGHALALRGLRVAVVDLDPQGQLSASLGLFKPPRRGIADVLLEGAGFDDVSVNTREGLLLVPAGQRLCEIERLQDGGVARARLLDEGVRRVDSDLDLMLIDCPPASGMLIANAVMAAGEVLIPVTGDYLGLNGLAHLMKTLRRFDSMRTERLQQHLVLSRLNPRRRLAREVIDKLARHFPGQVLASPVHEAAVLAECPGVGRTIFEYRGKSRSAQDFKALAEDIIESRTL